MKFHLHFHSFWEDEVPKKVSITERLTNLLGEPSASRADGEDLVLTFEGCDPQDGYMLDDVKLVAREEEIYVMLYDEARKTIRKGYWYDEDPDWVEQDHGDGFWAEVVVKYLG